MMYLGSNAVGLATSIPEFADLVKIEVGEYIPSTDELATDIAIPHSLGAIPDFIIYTAEGIDPTVIYNATYILDGSITNIFTDTNTVNYTHRTTRLEKTTGNIKFTNGIFPLDRLLEVDTISTTYFRFTSYTGYTLKANIKYKYILGKFKEVTSNA